MAEFDVLGTLLYKTKTYIKKKKISVRTKIGT